MVDGINLIQTSNIIQQKLTRPTIQNETAAQEPEQSKELISSDASNASKTYVTVLINKKIEPLSIDDYIAKLKNEGKTEGKDFKLEGPTSTCDNYNLEILNKDGNPVKTLYWVNGKAKENFTVYDENIYTDNKLLKRISKDSNDKVKHYVDVYYNDEIPQETFTNEKITYKTTSDEYMNLLKKEHKNFKVEYKGEEDNNRWISVNEFSENNKKTQATTWHFGEKPFNSIDTRPNRSIFNNDGKENKRIVFMNDRTEVCTYLNDDGKSPKV